jgi:hypothetical protein
MKPLDLKTGIIGTGAIGSSLSALFTGNGNPGGGHTPGGGFFPGL